MPTATTTYAAIRNKAVKTIVALTPKSLSGDKFRLTANDVASFTDYAEQHDNAVFREFEVEHIDTRHLPVADYSVRLKETDFRLVMAYPEHYALYATAGFQDPAEKYGNRGAMEAVIEQDADDITEAIGTEGGGNYLDGHLKSREEGWSTEQGEGVTFLIINITAEYYSAGT